MLPLPAEARYSAPPEYASSFENSPIRAATSPSTQPLEPMPIQLLVPPTPSTILPFLTPMKALNDEPSSARTNSVSSGLTFLFFIWVYTPRAAAHTLSDVPRSTLLSFLCTGTVGRCFTAGITLAFTPVFLTAWITLSSDDPPPGFRLISKKSSAVSSQMCLSLVPKPDGKTKLSILTPSDDIVSTTTVGLSLTNFVEKDFSRTILGSPPESSIATIS